MSTNLATGEITDIDLDAITAERAQLVALIDELTQRKNAIDDVYREHLVFGTHTLAGLRVSVQHNRRLDNAAIMQAYPVTACPELYKPTIDTTAVKKYIAPVDLDAFYLDGTPKVVVS